MSDTYHSSIADDPLGIDEIVNKLAEQLELLAPKIEQMVTAAAQARSAVSDINMIVARKRPELGHPELYDSAFNAALWARYDSARVRLVDLLGGQP